MKRYLVLGCKPWARRSFDESLRRKIPGQWRYLENPRSLAATVSRFRPDKIFVLHWSFVIPSSVWGRYECINFHMTDVPFGRGGSPLQNLILRGKKSTKLSALRVGSGFDDGPVYLKRPLSLAGTALEIYERAMDLAAQMIRDILSKNPRPRPQKGTPTLFRRVTYAENELAANLSPRELYDRIRMVDAPTYAPAYLRLGNWRVEFTHARLKGGVLHADIAFRKEGTS